MSALSETLDEAGLSRVAAAIEQLAKPGIQLTSGTPSDEPVNRLGGLPNLPKEIAWPEDDGGTPLSFIAQFDLASLPSVSDFPLPKSGSLYFFYNATDQPWGFDPKEKNSSRIIYSTASLTDHPACPFPDDLDEEAQFRGLNLIATLEPSLPSLNSVRPLELTEQEFVSYMHLLDEGLDHRLGGNPNEIQNALDIEAQFVSHGLYCGDGSGYKKGYEMGLDEGVRDWRLLLQIGSDHEAGMQWGDDGRIYFMIRNEDLRALRFENAWLGLQCS